MGDVRRQGDHRADVEVGRVVAHLVVVDVDARGLLVAGERSSEVADREEMGQDFKQTRSGAVSPGAATAHRTSQAPFFIVLNPGSGRQSPSETCALIETVLGSAGRRFDVLPVDRTHQLQSIALDAAKRAQAAGGIVVAAGGDGTINSVAQAALHSGCALGLLPRGTFNYFSRTHGIPTETAAALELLLTGIAQPVQVGLVNERLFAVNASVGLYPQLLEDREAYKQRFGRRRSVAFFAALFTLLRGQRQMRLRLEVGGAAHDLRTLTLFVGNNRLQLEQIGIEQAPAVERGQLSGIVLRPVGAPHLFWLLLRGALGTLGDADDVQASPSIA